MVLLHGFPDDVRAYDWGSGELKLQRKVAVPAVGAAGVADRAREEGRACRGCLSSALTGWAPVRDVRGIGHLYGVEVTPGLLWPLMRECEQRGVFFYPFTGAGDPRSEGLVVAPPLEVSNQYLPVLGKIAQFSKEADVPTRLMEITESRQFIQLLEEKAV